VAELKIGKVWKRFGEAAAVADVSVDVESGEFIALLGPSGCGKTTLLRLIAGFERPDGGSIDIGGRQVADSNGLFVPPESRRVGMVFQSYALWPHMSVAENVGYPLRVRKAGRSDITTRVDAALSQVGLDGLGDRRPANLSGGQRQRVALARCLAMEPDVVLLDEPLANLDAHLRESMQLQFRDFHRTTGATMVYVTHDQAEAMALADRIAVMDGGHIVQTAPPPDLYHRPATEMVARFIGRGQVVDAVAVAAAGDGRSMVEIAGRSFAVRGTATPGTPVRLCLRPEWIGVAARGDDGTIPARVSARTYRGAMTTLELDAGLTDETLVADVAGTAGDIGEEVGVRLQDGWILPAATGA
jgi:iron(III) transport system ATP-binding protein